MEVVKGEGGPREQLETLLVEASSLCDDVLRVLGGERDRAGKLGQTDTVNDVAAWDAHTRCLKNEILVRTRGGCGWGGVGWGWVDGWVAVGGVGGGLSVHAPVQMDRTFAVVRGAAFAPPDGGPRVRPSDMAKLCERGLRHAGDVRTVAGAEVCRCRRRRSRSGLCARAAAPRVTWVVHCVLSGVPMMIIISGSAGVAQGDAAVRCGLDAREACLRAMRSLWLARGFAAPNQVHARAEPAPCLPATA